MYTKRSQEELQFSKVGDEVVVHDRISGEVHLLPPATAVVFENYGVMSTNELSSLAFPGLEAKVQEAKLEATLQQLADQGLLMVDPALRMSRRAFGQKAVLAAALPAILTLAMPTPASAASLPLGVAINYTTAGGVTQAGVVPRNAVNYTATIKGAGGGGGGGGGGNGLFNNRGGAGGIAGGGELVTVGPTLVTGGAPFTVNLGKGGGGGTGGSVGSPVPVSPGVGGVGGTGGRGIDGKGTPLTDGRGGSGGGGGGGGEGGERSSLSGNLSGTARGGGGGGGGAGGSGVGNNFGLGGNGGAGEGGLAGGSGANLRGQTGKTGAGGTGSPGGSVGTAGAYNTNGGGGGPGTDGTVTITFN